MEYTSTRQTHATYVNTPHQCARCQHATWSPQTSTRLNDVPDVNRAPWPRQMSSSPIKSGRQRSEANSCRAVATLRSEGGRTAQWPVSGTRPDLQPAARWPPRQLEEPPTQRPEELHGQDKKPGERPVRSPRPAGAWPQRRMKEQTDHSRIRLPGQTRTSGRPQGNRKLAKT